MTNKNDSNDKPKWALPYDSPTPADPAKAKKVRVLRIALYIAMAAALIAPVIQLQKGTMRNYRKSQTYKAKLAAGTLSELELRKAPPKPHKGAVNRWRTAVRAMWDGQNIYLTPEQYLEQLEKSGQPNVPEKAVALHPNMPFTVILLTPFAMLPMWAGGLLFSILKVLAIAACILAAVRVANHRDMKMPDWVVMLGILWCVTLLISDIQHANTNSFVMAAIVLHLWLYRRGNDMLAGAALTIAICIKMTPALFVLYWLYQRNWKLLTGCVISAVVCVVVIPAALLGPSHYMMLMDSWLSNLIFKGLGGAWYPIHVNQSLPGVLSRYLLGGHPGGDIHWNPDDNPYNVQTVHGWIAFASLKPETVKFIIQICQAAIVAVMAWAIGWRKLPRNDGRRGLHYAMVISAILLLNQRTWAHHAATLLPAVIAIWYAIAFGRFSRKLRGVVLGLMFAGGVLLWITAGDLLVSIERMAGLSKAEAKEQADIVLAYGPDFYYFLIVFAIAAVLALAMKKSDPPYAPERQKLSAK